MARIEAPLMNQAIREALEREAKRNKGTQLYQVEIDIIGKAMVTVRAKNKQVASRSAKRDLQLGNAELDFLDVEKVYVTKVRDGY